MTDVANRGGDPLHGRRPSIWWVQGPVGLVVLGALLSGHFETLTYFVWALAAVGGVALLLPRQLMVAPLGSHPLRYVWVIPAALVLFEGRWHRMDGREFALLSLALLGALSVAAVGGELARRRESGWDRFDARSLRVLFLLLLGMVWALLPTWSHGPQIAVGLVALAAFFLLCRLQDGFAEEAADGFPGFSWTSLLVHVIVAAALYSLWVDDEGLLMPALAVVALLGMVAAPRVPGRALQPPLLLIGLALWAALSIIGFTGNQPRPWASLWWLLVAFGGVILVAAMREAAREAVMEEKVQVPGADRWVRVALVAGIILIYLPMQDPGDTPWTYLALAVFCVAVSASPLGLAASALARVTGKTPSGPEDEVVAAPAPPAVGRQGRVQESEGLHAPPVEAPLPAPGRAISPVVARMYAGKRCEGCGQAFEPGAGFIECPECRQWYHEACWKQLGGCVKEGCPAASGELAPPSAGARPDLPAQQVAVARAIHNVGFCPYCQTPVQAGVEHVICPACKTPYHPDCWQENNGCAVYGCSVRLKRD